MTNKKPIALLCSDLHLSHNPPLARAEEPNWLQAQKRVLDQIRSIQKENDYCPILFAGDLYDKWDANGKPELINFALEHLPENMTCVAGQHDLPLHCLADIEKSAYWTLVQTSKISHTPRAVFTDFITYNFSWGEKLFAPTIEKRQDGLRVGVIHEYTWYGTNKHTEATSEQFANHEKYEGFDVVVIGDNHIPWDVRFGDPAVSVFNCGSLQRTKSDQIGHHPRVGLLMEDGSIKSRELDTSQDIITKVEKEEEIELEGVQKFLQEIQQLQGASLDFAESLKRFMDMAKTSAVVRRHITQALEQKGTL